MTEWLSTVMVLVYILPYSLTAESCSSVGDVRLVESPYSGTVQYCYSASADTGEWIGVCSMGDSATLSEIVCRQVLNNNNADDRISALYMVTEQQTHRILLQCSDTDSQLSTCQSSLTTSTPCPGISVTCQGACTSGGRCVCTDGWRGLNCRYVACEPECGNGGNCTGPGQCTCDSARWEGTSCQQAVSPMFQFDSSISEMELKDNVAYHTVVSTTKRSLVPPYYEVVTPGRQVMTEIEEGEPAYDYPVIAVNREVQVVPPEDHQYEQPM